MRKNSNLAMHTRALKLAIANKGLVMKSPEDIKYVESAAGMYSRMAYKQHGLVLPKAKSSKSEKIVAIESLCTEALQTVVDLKSLIKNNVGIKMIQRHKKEKITTRCNYFTDSVVSGAIATLVDSGVSSSEVEDALLFLEDRVIFSERTGIPSVDKYCEMANTPGKKGPRAAGQGFQILTLAIKDVIEQHRKGD